MEGEDAGLEGWAEKHEVRSIFGPHLAADLPSIPSPGACNRRRVGFLPVAEKRDGWKRRPGSPARVSISIMETPAEKRWVPGNREVARTFAAREAGSPFGEVLAGLIFPGRADIRRGWMDSLPTVAYQLT